MRKYLMSVISAALLVTLLQQFVPKGKLKQLLGVVGGLVMILTVVAPVTSINDDIIPTAISKFSMQTRELQTGIQVKNRELAARIINNRCSEYILDKAAQMGVEVSVEITMSEQDYPYPIEIEIIGNVSQQDRDILSNMIEQELGVTKERQVWK